MKAGDLIIHINEDVYIKPIDGLKDPKTGKYIYKITSKTAFNAYDWNGITEGELFMDYLAASDNSLQSRVLKWKPKFARRNQNFNEQFQVYESEKWYADDID